MSLTAVKYGGVGTPNPIAPATRDLSVVCAPRRYEERLVDLGEVTMNYAVAGTPDKPALLMIPGQTLGWWAYEDAMDLLVNDFQIYAVDLRGAGKSTWTPGRYTLDNIANDLVRFIDRVIGRAVITTGCSSGGVLSAWLSAYALPGTIRGAHYEDPPLFASELLPACGHSVQQTIAGELMAMMHRSLGSQWSVGDWAGFQDNAAITFPFAGAMLGVADGEPPEHMRGYDPEWALSFLTGTIFRNCDHAQMLGQVKAPVLLTHHFRFEDPASGRLFAALSDLQAKRVCEIVKATGQPIEYQSHPDAAHDMFANDPPRFVKCLTEWAQSLPRE